MKIPVIEGIISRRMLLNYRVSPEVIEPILPALFRPKLFRGHAIAGICLIRLEQIRPKGFPRWLGISSENSAHRIAVVWENDAGEASEGVFVTRRDTDSRMNSIAGGRIFPGVHHFSRFAVNDENGSISLRTTSADFSNPLVDMSVTESADFPSSSIFASLEESSAFFESGCVGYSSRPDSCVLDGLQLKVSAWRVTPLSVGYVRSAYFDNSMLFPPTSIQFDHALLMRDIVHEWHSEPELSVC